MPTIDVTIGSNDFDARRFLLVCISMRNNTRAREIMNNNDAHVQFIHLHSSLFIIIRASTPSLYVNCDVYCLRFVLDLWIARDIAHSLIDIIIVIIQTG